MTKKKRLTVAMRTLVGAFAEDKDRAKSIRENILWPHIKIGGAVELDFAHVDDATQSFIHALLSELIRETHAEALDLIYFKNCNETVKGIINMVVEYMVEN